MGEMGSGSGSGSGREWMDMDGEVEVEVYVGGTRATYSLPAYLPYLTSPNPAGPALGPVDHRWNHGLGGGCSGVWESYWPRRA